MPFLHIRTQRPVGQGFFHTAMVSGAGGPAFCYVYDCGAMPKYRQARSNAIKAYRDARENMRPLDVLFLSHAHADHVNGVAQLPMGFAVDTIMLPLLSVEDRLIAFARSAAEAPASARDQFYRDFIADPAAALSRFAPRQILFVKPGSPDEGAPGGGGEEIGPYDEGGDQIGGDPRDGADRDRWKLVGRGRAENRRTVTGGGKGKASTTTDIATIPDSRAIAVDVADHLGPWLLAPYVDPGVVAERRRFFRVLRRQEGFDKRSLAAPDRLSKILSDKNEIAILVGAYKAVGRDLNVTSLCLYSGPAQDPSIQHFAWCSASMTNGRWNWFADGPRIAWLATGDAALREKRRVHDFAAHYGVHLGKVGTLTLPHHGSDNNADDKLLEKVKPSWCVASADRFSTWRHPGSGIMHLMASRSIPMALVTSSNASEFAEVVHVD
ncbi:MBL fold metallo-hydrolase [Methylocella sp.]|jgi:hypothetical protein|uniref:MBL fold metallo-hydrolase n=1 Tax=Methylocella sp. TaxID=1978226 RepID=UPI003C2150BB